MLPRENTSTCELKIGLRIIPPVMIIFYIYDNWAFIFCLTFFSEILISLSAVVWSTLSVQICLKHASLWSFALLRTCRCISGFSEFLFLTTSFPEVDLKNKASRAYFLKQWRHQLFISFTIPLFPTSELVGSFMCNCCHGYCLWVYFLSLRSEHDFICSETQYKLDTLYGI